MNSRALPDPRVSLLSIGYLFDEPREVPVDRAETFIPSPESVGRARQFVRTALSDDAIDLEAAVLLTSELASNAVTHARGDFCVRVSSCSRGVRVEVENHNPELLAIPNASPHEHGRGLRIIEQLAARWGAEARDDAKVVWFELPKSSVRGSA